jgi:hypothetical protein
VGRKINERSLGKANEPFGPSRSGNTVKAAVVVRIRNTWAISGSFNAIKLNFKQHKTKQNKKTAVCQNLSPSQANTSQCSNRTKLNTQNPTNPQPQQIYLNGIVAIKMCFS